MTSEKKLNKEQLKAIRHKGGPLLIIAGAGTGKTTVITERIKYLISKELAKPSEILALTFTEKAASEMQSRIEEALPYGYIQMWITTFHSFGDRILKQEAVNIGLSSDYHLLTEAESVQLIKDNLFRFDLDYYRPLGNPTGFVKEMVRHFSRLKDEDISVSDYIAWVDKKEKLSEGKGEEELLEVKKWKELAFAFKTYEEIKSQKDYIDFGDLIVKTILLFRKRPNILRFYQKRFKYILVDEFQDTNYAQYELIKLLAGKDANLTVVGDDDQSIYRFRGAAVSNIIQFKKDYPQALVVVLNKNYRSCQEILNKAYKLIRHNNPDRLEVVEKINKKLVSLADTNKENTGVFFYKTKTGDDEADLVAEKIIELVESEGFLYKDIAVLVRANNHADSFVRAFLRKNIPYQFLGPSKLFKKPEVLNLIAYLKILENVYDSNSFYRLLSSEYVDVPSRDIAFINSLARRRNMSIFEVCENLDEANVSVDTKLKIERFLEIVRKHLSLITKETAGQILFNFLEESGFLKKLVSPDNPQAQIVANNISKFFEKLKNYESSHEDTGVTSVVNWIDLSDEIGESPIATEIDWEEKDSVNIITVHSSKGLEFPVVFLVNLVEDRFPSRDRREVIPIPDELIKEILPVGDYHLEEERRLFYVGMTRAKFKLFLTASDLYSQGKRKKLISPFVVEALGEKVLNQGNATKANQLALLDYQPLIKESKVENIPLYVTSLSYTQIQTFKTCPLHYKLRYILNIPSLPTASQSFGTSMHLALRDFYRLFSKGKFKGFSQEKLIDELVSLLDKNWITDGFLAKEHEKQFFDKGKEYLKGYIEKEFNPNTKTALIEENFSVFLPLERPLKIIGRMDRVDILPNGGIEIIDYKSGEKVPTQKEVDRDLQMSFYAIAADRLREPPFDLDLSKIKFTLYYFENQTKLTTQRTEDQIKLAIEEIAKLREEIENSDFSCSGSYLCKSCEFRGFCNVD